MKNKIAILYYPEEYPPFFKWILGNNLSGLLFRGIKSKRNPRDSVYMEHLAKSTFGKNVEIQRVTDPKTFKAPESSNLVLLWPDAIGYGWTGLERRLVKKNMGLEVLNGRRRHFKLCDDTWRSYRFRRLIERFWLGELLFIGLFVFITPCLLAIDFLKGKD